MKVMLDCSPAKLTEYRERYAFDFWQLRTPLTKYARASAGIPYGLDNGCFAEFRQDTWERLLDEALNDPPLWACLPDIVGDAARTLDLFDAFYNRTHGVRRALVLQDGIERFRIPWDRLEAVFVGGTDRFKCSPEALAAARTAKMLGKWVHVGRVNTSARVDFWLGLADSLDGSGISRYDHMLEDVLTVLKGEHPQQEMSA